MKKPTLDESSNKKAEILYVLVEDCSKTLEPFTTPRPELDIRAEENIISKF